MQELGEAVIHINTEVGEVLGANRTIVDSIELLTSASEEVTAGTQTSKETIDQSFESLNMFCVVFEEAFEDLARLKQTTEADI